MIVAKITEEQANSIHGQEFITDNVFNCIQDIEGNWIISLQELVYCDVQFANSVELIEYKPIIVDLL